MMKKEIKQWLYLLLLTLGLSCGLTSLLELLLHVVTSIWRIIVIFEFAFISLILPIGLVHVHINLKHKFELKGDRIFYLFWVLTCIVCASLIDYYSGWYSGQYVDSETRDASALGILFQTAIAFLIGCVSFYGYFSDNNIESNIEKSTIA
jgi:hypothetical protein